MSDSTEETEYVIGLDDHGKYFAYSTSGILFCLSGIETEDDILIAIQKILFTSSRKKAVVL